MILNIYRHLFDAGIRPKAEIHDSSWHNEGCMNNQ